MMFLLISLCLSSLPVRKVTTRMAMLSGQGRRVYCRHHLETISET